MYPKTEESIDGTSPTPTALGTGISHSCVCVCVCVRAWFLLRASRDEPDMSTLERKPNDQRENLAQTWDSMASKLLRYSECFRSSAFCRRANEKTMFPRIVRACVCCVSLFVLHTSVLAAVSPIKTRCVLFEAQMRAKLLLKSTLCNVSTVVDASFN